jgi:hypothetical protein
MFQATKVLAKQLDAKPACRGRKPLANTFNVTVDMFAPVQCRT